MKSLTILLSLLALLPIPLALAEGYTLPDLGLDTTTPTCQNAQALITRTNQDLARLQNIVEDIPGSSNILQQVNNLVTQACSLASHNYSPATSFLQVQAKTTSMSKGKTDMSVKLTAAEEHAESLKDQDSYVKNLVNEKLDGIHDVLAQIKKKTSSGDEADNTVALCGKINSSLQDVIDYLDWLSEEITTNYIHGSLPQRIADIQNMLAQCQAEQGGKNLYVQTGSTWVNYPILLHPMALPLLFQRTDDVVIKFDKAFSEVPSVAVALRGFDLDTSFVSIYLTVVSVKKDQFTVRVTVGAGAQVYGAQISYLATITQKSGIYIATNTITKETNQDLRNMYKNNGDRRFTQHEPLPSDANTEKPLVFLSGFSFGPNSTPRIQVGLEGNTIVYKTSGDTVLYGVASTIIFQRKSVVPYLKAYDYSATTSGGLIYSNSGTRGETKLVPKAPFANPPEIFIGVTGFEFKKGYNYRLRQDDDVSSNNLKFTMETWSNTRVVSLSSKAVAVCSAPGDNSCLTK